MEAAALNIVGLAELPASNRMMQRATSPSAALKLLPVRWKRRGGDDWLPAQTITDGHTEVIE
jgi:hypothetical protein